MLLKPSTAETLIDLQAEFNALSLKTDSNMNDDDDVPTDQLDP